VKGKRQGQVYSLQHRFGAPFASSLRPSANAAKTRGTSPNLETLCSMQLLNLQKGGAMEFVMKDYLGDGVYGLFDGYAIWLHANDHENPTDRICLEPGVLSALNRFSDRCAAAMAEHAAQQPTNATSGADACPSEH